VVETLPTFETGRLLLRGLRKGDEPFLAMLDVDPVVMKFVHRGPLSLSQAEHFARVQVEMADGIWRRTGKWLVELKDTSARIGWVEVIRISVKRQDFLSVGYHFAQPFWGCGYAPEAVAAVLADCFERLEETSIVAYVRPDHNRSIRVLLKVGFRPTGQFIEDDCKPTLPTLRDQSG
jgi:RimJ/RimL family protein N-acetyltransferase